MGDVRVVGGSLAGDTIETLEVAFRGLPDRTIDRDTALAWMKDGHSFLPIVRGEQAPALLLREVDGALYIRHLADDVPSDALPEGLGRT